MPDFSSSRLASSDAHSVLTCLIVSWRVVQFSAFRFDVFLTAFQLVSVLCWNFPPQNFSFCSCNFFNFLLSGIFPLLELGHPLNAGNRFSGQAAQFYCVQKPDYARIWFNLCSVSIIPPPQRAYQRCRFVRRWEAKEARTAHWFVPVVFLFSLNKLSILSYSRTSEKLPGALWVLCVYSNNFVPLPAWSFTLLSLFRLP